MKKGLLLLILVVLLLQALFVVYKSRGTDDPEWLDRDPWAVAGLEEEAVVQEGKAAESAPYPGPRATNPDKGRGMIRGRVVDLTGTPQPGVMVVADHHGTAPPSIDMGSSYSARWSVEAGEDGRFAFSTLPGGHFTVGAYAPGLHALAALAIQEAGAAGELRLVLAETVTIEGVVHGPDGNVLADAWVYPVACDADPDNRAYARFPERTGKDGRFSLTHLRGGNWRLLAASRLHAPGLSDSVDPAAGEEAVIQLAAAGVIRGTVTGALEDNPASRVAVEAVDTAYGLETCRTRTDGKGRFQLAGLRPAQYSLSFAGAGVAPIYNPIVTSVGAGQTADLPPIWVKPAGQVRGRVLEAGSDDRGVKDALVRLRLPNDPADGGQTTRTDLGGYYLFYGVALGTCEVSMTPPPGLGPTTPPTVELKVEAGGQTDGPTFALAPGLTVAGRVEDAAGHPVPGANVYLAAEGRVGRPCSTRADAQARFAFDGLGGTESVTVWAVMMDDESAEAGPFALGGKPLDGLALKLDRPRAWPLPPRPVERQEAP